MPNDLVVSKVLDLDNTDERSMGIPPFSRRALPPCDDPTANIVTNSLQVPQAPSVSIRPLLLSTSQAYFVNLLRVRKSGILSRHQQIGPVCATTLKGR